MSFSTLTISVSNSVYIAEVPRLTFPEENGAKAPFESTCVMNQLNRAFGHGEADDQKRDCRAKSRTKMSL